MTEMVQPSAEARGRKPEECSRGKTAAILFRALLASGQITMRKVDGGQTLGQKPNNIAIDRAA